jgi:hypothetical protein
VGTQYRCQNQRRQALLRDHSSLNWIDYLEVLDQETPPGSPRQRTLLVRCFEDLPPLTRDNVRIEGGVRVSPVRVEWAFLASQFSTDPGQADEEPNTLASEDERAFFSGLQARNRVLVVRTDSEGDFSSYTLRLTASALGDEPPEDFDAHLAAVTFSFKVDCLSEFDCAPQVACPPEVLEEPHIDYLAKDYESFRRLMLDRLSVIMPRWQERNPADQQIALVELLAYVGDHLSYYQDAVANEAYLGIAKRRPSVKRHAKLLDYPMHDGCNARAWVALEVEGNGMLLPGPPPNLARPAVRFLTKSSPPRGPLSEEQLATSLGEGALVFETMHDLVLYEAHNTMQFYTWGDEDCCLPKGATRATLKERFEHLKAGDVLIFEEVRSPTTGRVADADPDHRCAVRLTQVIVDRGDTPLVDPLNAQEITEIAWAHEDALPFPLCLWDVEDVEDAAGKRHPVSVAYGNVVLVDHGHTREKELDEVPAGGRYRPPLADGPITQQGRVKAGRMLEPFNLQVPASAALRWQLRDVLPAVRLLQVGSDDSWEPQRDLLNSGQFDRHFVVEVVEEDGPARLRFGDDALGERPRAGAHLTARYRVGNGRDGNLGADAIAHVFIDTAAHPEPETIIDPNAILSVRNPLPAAGGTDPEPVRQVKLYAPQAFRIQERAVTEADYAEVAERHGEVQKAKATFRWTGSWLTAFVTLDRKGGRALDDDFMQAMRDHLGRYRLAGYDLKINGPVFVPLELAMTVCAKPGYFRSEVKRALLEAFSNRDLSGERRGFFHPDRFTFAQPVYLSELYERALQVDGVASLSITTLNRFGKAVDQEINKGLLETGRLEIVRLDNDPNFPENGKLEIEMVGGI